MNLQAGSLVERTVLPNHLEEVGMSQGEKMQRLKLHIDELKRRPGRWLIRLMKPVQRHHHLLDHWLHNWALDEDFPGVYHLTCFSIGAANKY